MRFWRSKKGLFFCFFVICALLGGAISLGNLISARAASPTAGLAQPGTAGLCYPGDTTGWSKASSGNFSGPGLIEVSDGYQSTTCGSYYYTKSGAGASISWNLRYPSSDADSTLDIWVYIPDLHTNAPSVNYSVSSLQNVFSRTIDQSKMVGWYRLGTAYGITGPGFSVTLTDKSGPGHELAAGAIALTSAPTTPYDASACSLNSKTSGWQNASNGGFSGLALMENVTHQVTQCNGSYAYHSAQKGASATWKIYAPGSFYSRSAFYSGNLWVYIPDLHTSTTSVQYILKGADSRTISTFTIDQSKMVGWYKLGSFSGLNDTFLTLSVSSTQDQTGKEFSASAVAIL